MGIRIWFCGISFNDYKLYYINHWNLPKQWNA